MGNFIEKIKGLSKGKKIAIGLAIVVIIGAAASQGGKENTEVAGKSDKPNTTQSSRKKAEGDKKDTSKEEKSDTSSKVPAEYKSALAKAKIYGESMNMSKAGIYDQLTSEYGEKFSKEAAKYAVDNVKLDYNELALKKAETYQKQMAISPSAIYDQLISEHGEKFTEAQAKYAIDNLSK
ncbi:MAG: Ltp family lipoprotein [Clostridium sp.]|uniref:Ltp family lipoprotein n=1 Tax=Clostridium sp. TaxID=1506 RepID=UPI003F3BFC6E